MCKELLIKKSLLNKSLIAIIALSVAGCSSSKPVEEIEIYTYAGHQLPAEPVNSKLMWAQPERPLPLRYRSDAPLLKPEYRYVMKKVTLDKAITQLRKSSGYKISYPTSESKKKVSIDTIGTVDLAASTLAEQVGLKAEVDHSIKEIILTYAAK